VLADEFDRRLERVWARARARGVIGDTTPRIRDHAASYLPAAWRVEPPPDLLDAGSGAGVPGLHLAALLPDTRVTLVDSSEARCQLARAAVAAVELGQRVTVVHARVEDLARSREWRGSVSAAVARLLGPPSEVAECVLPLLSLQGRLVVSVSEETRKWWESAPLEGLGVVVESVWSTDAGSYLSVLRTSEAPVEHPRRAPSRGRMPWPGEI
jgi:16S rRNA G527 N7-methylase RsmG